MRENKSTLPPFSFCHAKKKIKTFSLITLISIANTSTCFPEENLKGNLNKEELSFINNKFIPIIIEAGICTSAKKDCLSTQFITCYSSSTLSCDVYGIRNKKIVMRIFKEAINSELNISHFNFWESKYHHRGFFEKPILEYTNRQGD